MNEHIPQNANNHKNVKSEISDGLSQFFQGTIRFIMSSMNMRDGADKERIVVEIKKNISFKGHVAWILVCSIFIASIGLNLNSTAVIIGAMLLSPLMGPILGIGLGVGIYDRELLIDSIRNFILAVVISLVTAWIYFLISPLKEITPEMLSRTNPSILDALIALFGGLAGIIAVSRKEISNVIPGVAIATALMPPLCTAGYGLAVGEYEIFFEAFYLFFLNSSLIFIPTFLVIKYLGLPVVHQLNEAQDRKVKLYILTFTLLILIPSGYIFYNMIQEFRFKSDAKEFVVKNFKYKSEWITKKTFLYTDSVSVISINFNDNILSPIQISELRQSLLESIDDCRLDIIQPQDKTDEIAGKLRSQVKAGILEEIYKKNEEQLKSKEDRIYLLEQKVVEAEHLSNVVGELKEAISINVSHIEDIIIANEFVDSAGKRHKRPIIMVRWKKDVAQDQLNAELKRLSKNAHFILKNDALRVIEF